MNPFLHNYRGSFWAVVWTVEIKYVNYCFCYFGFLVWWPYFKFDWIFPALPSNQWKNVWIFRFITYYSNVERGSDFRIPAHLFAYFNPFPLFNSFNTYICSVLPCHNPFFGRLGFFVLNFVPVIISKQKVFSIRKISVKSSTFTNQSPQ